MQCYLFHIILGEHVLYIIFFYMYIHAHCALNCNALFNQKSKAQRKVLQKLLTQKKTVIIMYDLQYSCSQCILCMPPKTKIRDEHCL